MDRKNDVSDLPRESCGNAVLLCVTMSSCAHARTGEWALTLADSMWLNPRLCVTRRLQIT